MQLNQSLNLIRWYLIPIQSLAVHFQFAGQEGFLWVRFRIQIPGKHHLKKLQPSFIPLECFNHWQMYNLMWMQFSEWLKKHLFCFRKQNIQVRNLYSKLLIYKHTKKKFTKITFHLEFLKNHTYTGLDLTNAAKNLFTLLGWTSSNYSTSFFCKFDQFVQN